MANLLEPLPVPTLLHSVRESNGNWVLDNAELRHLQTLLDDPCRKSVTDNQSETFSYHKDMQKIFFNPFLLLVICILLLDDQCLKSVHDWQSISFS